jgi:hypothetical protein
MPFVASLNSLPYDEKKVADIAVSFPSAFSIISYFRLFVLVCFGTITRYRQSSR